MHQRREGSDQVDSPVAADVRGCPDAHCPAAGAAGAGMTALWGRMAWHGSRWEKCALMKAKEQVPPPQRGRPAVFPGLLCSRFATAVAEKPKGTIMASIFSRIRGMSV